MVGDRVLGCYNETHSKMKAFDNFESQQIYLMISNKTPTNDMKERRMTNGTIVKRDGRKEHPNIDKIHKVVEEACKGLAGVSASAN